MGKSEWLIKKGVSMEARTEKPRIDPETVKSRRQVQRRPCGRFCTVEQVNEDRSKVLVRDGSTSVWVNMSTLVDKWA